MSTTRHLVNRQRRLATVAAERTAAPATVDKPVEPGTVADEPEGAVEQKEQKEEAEPRPGRPPRLRVRLPAVLCAATVLLGAFAAWAFTSAATLKDDPSRQNTALTDIARTSEVKGQITEAAGAVFSYNYASPAKADAAVKKYLTGKAIQQHQDMLAEVRAQAPKQKLVLTTTVTESGVEMLDGDRARLIIFADQSNTRTGKAEQTTYAAAMFAVDAVRRGGTWRISAIDTFTR
ncbi:hypothetical protein [Streptomyces sp. NBC_01022]|uniref:hypothetical protein n=1 Tax=Streptomyces sp. NBC_01022 TaxID=2903723 RepID=UPI002DDC10FD|nr:hypothetical protein [Streptomyces sp. NBC_01022]WRZ85914.1 hypothetical protein OG316_39370 [Streptomyces sp. NBC_01022]